MQLVLFGGCNKTIILEFQTQRIFRRVATVQELRALGLRMQVGTSKAWLSATTLFERLLQNRLLRHLSQLHLIPAAVFFGGSLITVDSELLLFGTYPMFDSLNAYLMAVVLWKVPALLSVLLGARRVKQIVKDVAQLRWALIVSIVTWLLGNVRICAFDISRVTQRLQAIVDIGFSQFLFSYGVWSWRTKELLLRCSLRCTIIVDSWMVALFPAYYVV